MKKIILAIIASSFLLTACGRQHPGKIINDTDETLLVSLKLNYPYTEECPDNYFREDIFSNYKTNDPEYKTASDYTISFDSIKNTALLKLMPDEEIDLGTVRAGCNRNNYKSWEFTEITCKGNKGYKMHAKDEEIMEYVDKPMIFGDYDFEIE